MVLTLKTISIKHYILKVNLYQMFNNVLTLGNMCSLQYISNVFLTFLENFDDTKDKCKQQQKLKDYF